MNKKVYIKPRTECFKVNLTHQLMVLSDGKQKEIIVNDPNEEVDAGNALSRKGSIWDDWDD